MYVVRERPYETLEHMMLGRERHAYARTKMLGIVV